ncbi:MAG: IS200/IS605 family transposase [Planctomycetota bacterium]
MAQSLCRNIVHLIFSTKNRREYITDRLREPLFAYLAGVLNNWDSPAIAIGGAADHVHLLFLLSKNNALCRIVEEVKRGSSKWCKQQNGGTRVFAWQNGYAAFSVSESKVDSVVAYIEKQSDHHREVPFQEEVRQFLVKHGVTFDERFVWD